MSTTVRIPNTLQNWPWQRIVHPHYEQCKNQSLHWINGFSSSFSPRLESIIIKCDYSLSAAMCFVNVNEGAYSINFFRTLELYLSIVADILLTGCNFMALILVFDEWTDASGPTHVRVLADIVMDAIKNPSKHRPEGEHVIGEIARQFWEKAVHTASRSSQRRFIAAFQKYVDAVVQESADRERGIIRTIEDYFKLRRCTVAMLAAFAINEMNLNIPDNIIENELIQSLMIAAVDLVIMDNDMFSYNREQSESGGQALHNLVTVVMAEFDLSVQQSFDTIGDMHRNASEKFLEDMANIPSWGREIDEQVKVYIDSLGICVRGCNQWSFECERYFEKDASRVFSERTVQLLPNMGAIDKVKAE